LLSNHQKEAIQEIGKLEKVSRINQRPKLQGYLFNIKGGEQFALNRAERGRDQYKKAIHYLKIAKNSVGIKANYINVANSFAAQPETGDSAIYYYNLALKIEKYGYTQFSKALRLNYSRLQITRGDFREAISLLRILASDSTAMESIYAKVLVEMNLADAYYLNKQNDSSIYHYKKARNLAIRHGMIQASTISRGLAFAYEDKKEYKAAFNLLRESDSLNIIDRDKQIASLSEESHLKHLKELHQKQNELQSLEIKHHKKRNSSLYIFAGIFIILALFLFILYTRIRSKNKTLARKNLELTKRNTQSTSKQIKHTDKKSSPELIRQLENQLYKEKIFTNPELSEEKLAKKLNTNRTYLSENVNQHFGKSFRSVINQLRIEEACQLLSNKEFDHFSIEGIAISVGYRNLSSFNSTFKRETGITPSFFRKNHLTT
jgi:AraC-like DNA-binding protein